jgi:hypothetical protein
LDAVVEERVREILLDAKFGGGRKQEERKRGRSVFVYAVLDALEALASSSMPSPITGMTMNFTN